MACNQGAAGTLAHLRSNHAKKAVRALEITGMQCHEGQQHKRTTQRTKKGQGERERPAARDTPTRKTKKEEEDQGRQKERGGGTERERETNTKGTRQKEEETHGTAHPSIPDAFL